MKKLFAILMLLIYLPGINGVAIADHFCGNKLASVNIEYLFPSSSNHISTNGLMGCCKDVNHFYKIRDAHQQVANNIIIKAPVLQMQLISPALEKLLTSLPSDQFITALHAPPLLTSITPLYIHFSVFRI